ncbi:MAG: ion transporter [Pirellulales bacterium]|nr:ion transporter [Pirellulales bacterium]
MKFLRELLEEPETRHGRSFALSIQALILLSLIAFSIETIPELPTRWRSTLHYFELVTVILFTVEYVLRVYVARNKLAFATSFFGVIDLFAILPFYLSLGVDLRSIRAFRLLRLFRIFKLARFSRASRRFHSALVIAREEIILFLAATGILLYLSAVGIYTFEHSAQPEAFSSVFDSLWWSVVTLTTVGYGDVYPITVGGRIFTFSSCLSVLESSLCWRDWSHLHFPKQERSKKRKRTVVRSADYELSFERTTIQRISVMSSMVNRTPSRPSPLSLTPP